MVKHTIKEKFQMKEDISLRVLEEESIFQYKLDDGYTLNILKKEGIYEIFKYDTDDDCSCNKSDFLFHWYVYVKCSKS